MAEQPRQVVYTPVDIEDAEFTVPLDPHEEYENAEFDAFKAEMHDSQDDAKITVGKKMTDARGRPMGKKTFECFECGIDDYTFSQLCTRIREDFGTGLYLIQGRDSKGKFKFKKVIGVQAPIDPNLAKNADSPASLIASMSQAMADQQDRFERMIHNTPQAQTDPIKQMTEMMTAMGGMMGALGLGGQNQQQPKTMLETLTELKLTKDIIGDLVGNSGESGGVDNFWGAIAEATKSLGAPLMQAIALAQEKGEINQDGVIQLPASAVEPHHTIKPDNLTESDKSAEPDAMNLKQMKEQLDFLLIQAKAEVSPELVVDFIIGQMPDNDTAYDNLEQFLQQENCLDQCVMILPEINDHRGWFINWQTAMLAKLDAMIEPVEPVEPDHSDHPVEKKSAIIEKGDDLTSDVIKPDDASSVTDTTGAGDAKPDDVDASRPKSGDSLNPDGDSSGSGGDIRDS